MREIKFRAWDRFNWKFHFFELIRGVPNWITGNEVQQYTGLKDADGVEWYEGDILGVNDPEDDSRCEIVFKAGAFQRHYRHGEDGPFSVSLKIPFDLNCWQVIGNIYETPQLVEDPTI